MQSPPTTPTVSRWAESNDDLSRRERGPGALGVRAPFVIGFRAGVAGGRRARRRLRACLVVAVSSAAARKVCVPAPVPIPVADESRSVMKDWSTRRTCAMV